jgi:hypothetical protein
LFPAVSLMLVLYTSFVDHVTLAPVAAPFESTRASGADRDAPAAAFHRLRGTTPATSWLDIVVTPPTKSIPIAAADVWLAAIVKLRPLMLALAMVAVRFPGVTVAPAAVGVTV